MSGRAYQIYSQVESEIRPMAPVAVAAGIWLGGLVMTELFLAQAWPGDAAPLTLWGWALLIQLALSILQSPVWNRAGAGWLNWFAIVVDTLINAAQLREWTAGLPATDVWRFLEAMLPDRLLPAVDGAVLTWGLALVLGAVVAYAPERILFGSRRGAAGAGRRMP